MRYDFLKFAILALWIFLFSCANKNNIRQINVVPETIPSYYYHSGPLVPMHAPAHAPFEYFIPSVTPAEQSPPSYEENDRHYTLPIYYQDDDEEAGSAEPSREERDFHL